MENGFQGGTHWRAFHIEDNKSYYFDSFGGSPDNYLLNQLPEPVIFHNYKNQDVNSKKCGTYCLYFFYLMERFNYYDAVLNKSFV